MDVQEFEQAILRLAFETDARITTASVAYYLGIPSRKANELLNALLEEGVLELDSDQDGNLYYRVPNQPEGSEDLMPRLRREQRKEVDAGLDETRSTHQGARHSESKLSPSVMLVSATEEDDSEPISPRPGQPSSTAGSHSQSTDLVRLAGRRGRFEQDDNFDAPTTPGSGSSGWPGASRSSSPVQGAGHRVDGRGRPVSTKTKTRGSAAKGLFAGLTQRQAQPDASLDRCGASSVIVSDEVRCEPRPLPSQKPVVASCMDSNRGASRVAQRSASASSSGELFDRAQSQSTMLAPTASGQLAVRQDQLERPEHQPGMALLLSLILCGTGQIYNGEVSKGIMMMVLCFLLWFVLLGWVVHIWSIVDSVVVAERLNRKAG
jgi:hypothetical protein